jgi:tetratricopeptide (TPR) repeat protein
MLRRPVTLVLAICMAGAACARDPESMKAGYLKDGDAYLAKKQYDDAILTYRRALQLAPQSGEVHWKLAEAFRANRDIVNALPEYVRAADRLPDNMELQLKAGNLLLLAGRFQDAKNRARTALRKDPQSVAALVLLGNALAGLRSLDEAVDVAERAVETDPERPGLYGNLGTLHLARGDRQLAGEAFKKAVALAGKTPGPYLALSNFYRSGGDLGEAEKALRTAYEFAPKDIKINRALASLLIEANRGAEAEAYLQAAAIIDEDVQSKLALSDYYLQSKRYSDAIRILNDVTKEKKAFLPAKIRIAIVQLAEHKRKDAYQTIDSVLAQTPQDVTALAFKARLLVADHRLDDAAALMQTAMSLNPRSAQVQYMLGQVREARGELEDARKAYNEALDIEPFGVDSVMALASLHRRRGELDTAISFAERGVRNQPDSIATRLTLIRSLLARSEDYPRAEKEAKALLERYPAQASAHAIWGTINVLARNPGAARQSYEKALSLDPDNMDAYTGLMALDRGTPRLAALTRRLDERIARGNTDSNLLLLAAKTAILAADFKHAEDLLRRAISGDEGQLDAYVLLGELYILQRRVPDAIQEFLKMAALDSKSVPTATMLGLLYQRQNNPAESRKWYEKAVQVNPRVAAAAANNLACMYVDANSNLDQALQYAQYAVSANPQQPEFNDTLGWVYYKKQMYEQALKPLNDAAADVPNHPIVQYHLGLTYAAIGEDAKARKALELALKVAPKFDGANEAKRVLATLVY